MKLKKILAAASSFAVMFSGVLPAFQEMSGNTMNAFAEDAAQTESSDADGTWTIDESGTLTISGSGSMSDLSFREHSDSVVNIVIKEGVTDIPKIAFAYFEVLENISIAGSVASIGEYSFTGCSALESLIIPDSVSEIGECAFVGCAKLSEIRLSENLTGIGDNAFNGCTSLTEIEIPASVTAIGENIFVDCPEFECIKGVSGSEAEKYAENNGYKFIAVEDSDNNYNYIRKRYYSNYHYCSFCTVQRYCGRKFLMGNRQLRNYCNKRFRKLYRNKLPRIR